MIVQPTNINLRDEHATGNESIVRRSFDLKIRIPLPLSPCHPRCMPIHCSSSINRRYRDIDMKLPEPFLEFNTPKRFPLLRVLNRPFTERNAIRSPTNNTAI